MVNERGQLYTMEGVAAGVIMLLTAYIVVSTTSIYTPGDTHIPDMQLEQLGSDVLAMMDMPNSKGDDKSDLERFIAENRSDDFRTTFLNYCNTTGGGSELHMSASVTYRSGDSVGEYPFVGADSTWTGRESAVRVTRWVQLSENPAGVGIENRSQAVLVEVLLWRA